ncbi:hypothetical protein V8Z80_10825 [Orrella sp. JC864]|uniref:hypothetical protein n=1 Tax=Orrella sp. JC864 TaxID=3120298 RepID=UPI0012BD5C20
MRLFELFLRRAGVAHAAAQRQRRAVSRLTIECPQESVGQVRKRIYTDFQAAGLDVSHMEVDRAEGGMAAACLTVSCPADKRRDLMSQARLLNQNPEITRVRWGDARKQA